MRTRALLATAAALTVVLAGTSGAAAKPQIVDPKGDNVGPAGTDIQSVLFEPVRKRGAKKTTGFRVTLVLDAPATRTPGVLYRIFGNQDNCGTFQMSSAATAALVTQNQVGMSCGEPDTTGTGEYTIVNVSPVADGNKLVWTFKLTDLPAEMRSGTMSELEAFISPADPVTGIFNTADESRSLAFDSAASKTTFSY